LLAALRGGIQVVIIPQENERELTEIPKTIKQNLDIRPVKWIDEVFAIALQHAPAPGKTESDELVKSDGAAGDDERDAVTTH
jgi:ATP-dependent Lon protease